MSKLLHSSVIAKLTRLTLPGIGGMLAIMVFNLTDTRFVSRLGNMNFMGVHIFLNAGCRRYKDSSKNYRKFPASLNEQLIQQVEDFAIGGLKSIKEIEP